MATDPSDTVCPECGEPIGTRATYCMHCDADLTETDPDVSETDDFDTGIRDGEASSTDASASTSAGDDSESDDVENVGYGTTAGDEVENVGYGPTEEEVGPSEPVLDPDGFLDNSLTVVLGIAGGLVVGLLAFMAFVFMFGAFGLVVAFLAWIGTTAVLVRQRTFAGAIQYGGYAVGIVLALIPVGIAVGADGPIVARLMGSAIFAVPAGFFAILSAAIGHWAGRWTAQDADETGGEDGEDAATV